MSRWPGGTTGVLLVLGVAVSIATWRLAPFAAALWVAIIIMVAGACFSRRLRADRRWLLLFSVMPVVVAALLVAQHGLPGLWPCDLGCGGGGAYATLGPMPTALLGLVASLVLPLGLIWERARAGRRRAAAPGGDAGVAPAVQPASTGSCLWSWVMIGGSLYFIDLSVRLHMHCTQCGAFHTANLAVLIPLLHDRLAWWKRLLALSAGAGLMLALYGVQLRYDVLAPPLTTRVAPPAGDAQEQRWAQSADAGRHWGSAHAPLQLELALDYQCPHCAASFDSLMADLDRSIAANQLQVVVRSVVRPSEAASTALAHWSFAAAARGEHRRYVRDLLGSRIGSTALDIVHGPASEDIDLPQLVQDVALHAASCQALTVQDQQRLAALGYVGQTPFVVLLDHDGIILARWSVSIDLHSIDAAIAANLGKH